MLVIFTLGLQGGDEDDVVVNLGVSLGLVGTASLIDDASLDTEDTETEGNIGGSLELSGDFPTGLF